MRRAQGPPSRPGSNVGTATTAPQPAVVPAGASLDLRLTGIRGNPLWGLTLDALPATGERPIFSSSRRPPPNAIAPRPVSWLASAPQGVWYDWLPRRVREASSELWLFVGAVPLAVAACGLAGSWFPLSRKRLVAACVEPGQLAPQHHSLHGVELAVEADHDMVVLRALAEGTTPADVTIEVGVVRHHRARVARIGMHVGERGGAHEHHRVQGAEPEAERHPRRERPPARVEEHEQRLDREYKRYDRNPVYDTRLMNDMIASGLALLVGLGGLFVSPDALQAMPLLMRLFLQQPVISGGLTLVVLHAILSARQPRETTSAAW